MVSPRFRLLGTAVCAALGLSSLVACTSTTGSNAGSTTSSDSCSDVKAFYLNPTSADPFWVAASNTATEYGAKHNLDLRVLQADDDAATQASQVASAISQGAKVLLVAAVDSKAIASSLQAAQDKGVKVVTINRTIAGIKADAATQLSSEVTGELVGAEMVKRLEEAGKTEANVFVLRGASSDEYVELVNKGFAKGLESSPSVKVTLVEKDTNWDPTLAASQTQSVLSDQEIDAIFANSDFLLPGIQPVLARTDHTPSDGDDHILLLGAGGLPAALDLIRQGWQDATFEVPVSGQTIAGVMAAEALVCGKPMPDLAAFTAEANLPEGSTFSEIDGVPTVDTAPTLVDSTNVDSPELWANQG